MGRRIIRTDDPLGTRNSAAQAASESAALATMAGGMLLGALWPERASAADAARAATPADDTPNPDQAAPDSNPTDSPPVTTAMPEHAGLRETPDEANATAEPHTNALAATPVPEAAPIAAAASDSVDARIDEAGAGQTSASMSAEASASSENGSSAHSALESSSILTPANSLLPSLFEELSQVTNDLAGGLSGLTNGVTEALAATTGQISNMLGPQGIVSHVTDTLADTVSATQNLTQDLVSDIAGVVTTPAGPLTEILGTPSNDDALASPVAPSFAPDTLDSSAMIDTAGMIPAEITGITLGFMGTSYADSVDPHDLGFSPLGGGLHGLI